MKQRLIDANKLKADIAPNEYFWEMQYNIDSAPTIAILPENPTNGDVIKAMFPNKGKYGTNGDMVTVWGESQCVSFSLEWWNAPYKKEVEE